MITRIATIFFFLAFGLALFVPGLDIVARVSALVAGVAMLAGA